MSEAKLEFDQKLGQILDREVSVCKKFISAERLSGGASQETYRITVEGDSGTLPLAMRRTPGGVHVEAMPGHPGLETEAKLMQAARAVGVPEPEVYYVLQPGDGLGDGFIMQWIDGEALGARINRADDFAEIRPKLAYECGRVLAQIHGIDVKQAGLDSCLATIRPEEFLHQTWDRYKALEYPAPMIDYAGRWLQENLPENYDLALVHNDFRTGNFMLKPDGISAVLDWELAHIGDPMRDLGWICTNSWRFGGRGPVGGFGEYEDLFRGYQEASGRQVDPRHVKFWEVFGSFWWAVGCLGMAEHYRTGPDKTVERPAIGRRSSECQIDCVNLLMPGPVSLVEAPSEMANIDMPTSDELLVSVRDFLREDVMSATKGRTNFLARVAANSLDIVLRELTIGMEARHQELARLQKKYSSQDGLETLRWRLVKELRGGQQALDDDELCSHLRNTVANQIAVDQPRYSGFGMPWNTRHNQLTKQ